LPYRVRWQDLKDLFRKAGTVLRADVSLGPDNRSRGYGTVLLATAEDAGRAVDMFNGYSWQTRILEVRLDRLLPEYDPAQLQLSSSSSQNVGSSSGASTSTGSTSHPSMTPVSSIHGSMSSRNLFVGNLPFHCQWQDLKDLFRQAGTILRADVALGPDNRSRGFGTVVFATDYDAERAMKMFNGYEYHGRVLKVHFDR
ncbi:RNA-binding domain-containing protein, partial [Pholiota conissans]